MTMIVEPWTVNEATLAAALKTSRIDVSPDSPLASLSLEDAARTAHAPVLNADQRRALSAVCRPTLGMGVLLSPPHGLDLVWFFDAGKPDDPLVRYQIDARGDHDFREVGEDALLGTIRACLHLETPTLGGDFTLALSAEEFQTLIGLADANREQSLRSLLNRLPDPGRTFSVADVWTTLATSLHHGDGRWLTPVAQTLTPFDLTMSEEVCARGLEVLVRRGLLEPQAEEWRLTDSGRVLCAALATPIAYAALHGRWAEGSGAVRREHVAAFRTLESLWLLRFQKLDSASPVIELRPVSGEEADLAFSERVFEWRRAARQKARDAVVAERRCRTCGLPITAEARFCSKCGTPVAAGFTPAMAPAPAERRCPNLNCSRTVAPGKKFCASCGTPVLEIEQSRSRESVSPTVKATPPERRCPKCSKIVPAGKKFCTADGTPVP